MKSPPFGIVLGTIPVMAKTLSQLPTDIAPSALVAFLYRKHGFGPLFYLDNWPVTSTRQMVICDPVSFRKWILFGTSWTVINMTSSPWQHKLCRPRTFLRIRLLGNYWFISAESIACSSQKVRNGSGVELSSIQGSLWIISWRLSRQLWKMSQLTALSFPNKLNQERSSRSSKP